MPAEHQIRGLGPILISVPQIEPTHVVLTEVMNLRPVREYPHPENAEHTVRVYEMGKGGPHAELHVALGDTVESKDLLIKIRPAG